MAKKPTITLVLGGCRSGKSSFAKKYAEETHSSGIFVATAQPLDKEMKVRIARHKKDRGPFWQTQEIFYELPGFIQSSHARAKVILVDCLTLWLSNCLLRYGEKETLTKIAELLTSIKMCDLHAYYVANEVGLGIVPEHPLGRAFRDLAGMLNREMALLADEVVFMVAGIPMYLKKGLGNRG
jgi:adenosylcobinamide kinase / adenosylcobinamide-phosphate guanylyltransferase